MHQSKQFRTEPTTSQACNARPCMEKARMTGESRSHPCTQPVHVCYSCPVQALRDRICSGSSAVKAWYMCSCLHCSGFASASLCGGGTVIGQVSALFDMRHGNTLYTSLSAGPEHPWEHTWTDSAVNQPCTRPCLCKYSTAEATWTPASRTRAMACESDIP